MTGKEGICIEIGEELIWTKTGRESLVFTLEG
jgi:hypothetical protein